MTTLPKVFILSGGVGAEREIALVTGQSLEVVLQEHFPVVHRVLDRAALPPDIDYKEGIVFPALHGEFGEDGSIQQLLEDQGIHFAGSDGASSRLCIHKSKTKSVVAKAGVRVIPGMTFTHDSIPSGQEIRNQLGDDLVLKPVDKGSSVDLFITETPDGLEQALNSLKPGTWLVEKRIRGRELSIGILRNKALGVVELRPQGGIYDFERKYQAGQTEYLYPAELNAELIQEIRGAAEIAVQSCGCRDFARVDFMLSSQNELYFLEINTLPGLTPHSLLPKSASCHELSFSDLAKELVLPAMNRFNTGGWSSKA